MVSAPGSRDADRRVLRWLVWLLVALTAWTLYTLWLPLVVAVWFAQLSAPLAERLARVLGGRRRVAASLILFALTLVLVPITLSMVSLVSSASEVVRRVMASPEWRAALAEIVADSGGGVSVGAIFDPSRMVAVLREHGETAWSVVKSFFGVTAIAVVHIFVFFLAAFAFLDEGGGIWRWIVAHAPLDARHLERMRAAFQETGRGLVIGVGLTALAQAVVALIAYMALGVPRSLLLAQLTFFAAFIPTFGTALVWVPVAAGLLFADHLVKALVLMLIGIFVIGTIDNVLRPVFSRWGALDLPVFVLIIAIFGGFAVFGPWGFLLGPLIVRLTKEALAIARDERAFGGS
jgi:predicted PurR-regulated permease PerM